MSTLQPVRKEHSPYEPTLDALPVAVAVWHTDHSLHCINSRALEGVLKFCGMLFKEGGDINIEAGQVDVEGEAYAEIKVTTTSAGTAGLADSETFRAATRVGDNHVGIGIEVARKILGPYHGDVFFRKESARKGHVIIQMTGLSG